MNAITYKEVFPLIQNNLLWIGRGFNMSLIYKSVYENTLEAYRKFVISKGFNPDEKFIKVPGICWFTNIDHGRRHNPISMLTTQENITYSKHSEIKGYGYYSYQNFDGIDVPYIDAIPSDYDGVMGVPITFLDKYCPEQFELLGNGDNVAWLATIGVKPIGASVVKNLRDQGNKSHVTANMTCLCYTDVDGNIKLPYKRILIRRRK